MGFAVERGSYRWALPLMTPTLEIFPRVGVFSLPWTLRFHGLLDHLTRDWPLGSTERSDFCRELHRLARGNVATVVEVCRRAAVQLDGSRRRINPRALWLDWLGERCGGGR